METRNFVSLSWRTVVLIVLVQNVYSAPTGVGNDSQAMFYLSQFGYLPSNTRNLQSGAIVDEKTWNKAVADFQAFAGLEQTGHIDEPTLETMKLPRCGVKDKVGSGNGDRSKRYALQGSRWKVKHLTYKIYKYPAGLEKSKVDNEVKRAFNVWSKYTDLTFEQKRIGQVHIEIGFEKGEHGDGDPFDGPGGTLAHAYFPVFGGDAHFDAEERWSIDSYRGTNLFQVAAHEFGHSLGLSHSDVRSALMAPFYRGYDPVFQLDDDDIEGIQALYGKKSSGGSKDHIPKATTEQPSKSDDTVLCKDPSFDTIFNTADGSTYVFKGDKYWKVDEETVAPGYPKLIRNGWPGLPSNIDAAFTYKNGKSYFFKGKQYWRYVGRKVDGAYPKDISEGFTGIPDNVDAAMVWSGNGKIYFFKGTKFWRFDPSQRPPVKSTYPKLLSNWEGVPDNLEAAFQYTNGYTYFFKKGAYYRFNDRAFAVERVSPSFPRSTAWWWFGCKNAPKGTIGNLIDRSSSGLQDYDDVVEKNKPLSQHTDVEGFASDLVPDNDGNYEKRVTHQENEGVPPKFPPKDNGAFQNVAPLVSLILATLVAKYLIA